jgi:hypothetical protein
MRQLGCMSADVYCQKLNNRSYTETSYLYSNGKKGGNRLGARETESGSKIELASIVKMAIGERLNILG